jgi:hypothetical protein
VKNNTCDWSTKTSVGSWCYSKTCAKVEEGPSDTMCILLGFKSGCYIFDQNLIVSQNDFTHHFLIPYYIYVIPSLIVVVFGFEFLLIFFTMFIPEIFFFLSEMKRRKWKILKHWRFLFSIRHQSIFCLLLSSFLPSIWAFIDIWTVNFLYYIGVVISFLIICLTFIQIITLWSHSIEVTKNFGKSKLSTRNV